MKTLTLIALLSISSIAFAQDGFKLESSVGIGVEVDKEYNVDLLQTNFTLTPQQVFGNGRFAIGLKVLGVTSDSLTTAYTGLETAVRLVQTPNNVTVNAGLEALIGFEGRKLFGGNLSANFQDQVSLTVSAYQENKSKNGIFNLSLGYFLLR